MLGVGMASLTVTALAVRAGLIEGGTPMAERGMIGDKWRVAERERRMASQGNEENKLTTRFDTPFRLTSLSGELRKSSPDW